MLSRITLLLLTVLIGDAATASGEGDDHDLIGNMGALQYFSHKLDLSIRHENRDLVDFYAHEIEETIEATTKIEAYHDKPVGDLTEAMLMPAFERFEQAVDDQAGGWGAIDNQFGALIKACNACHQATEYGYINIERTDANPYMQSFGSNKP